jgi:oligopeptide transport system substrate-binding protein
VEAGGKSWTFTLRPARWSDGTALTSKDVAEAWRKAGVKAVVSASDPRVLKAVFAQPVADVSVFSSSRYLLFPETSSLGRAPGPFVLASQEPGHPLTLVRNEAFRDAKAIRLAGLEFRFVPSPDEATALFRDGVVDWVPLPSGPGTFVPPGLRHLVAAPGWGLVFLRLNQRSPRLGDPDYRRQLAAALDRTAVSRGLRGAKLVPSATLVPGATPPRLAPVHPTVGPRPEPVLTLLYPQGETYRLIALEVADQWNQKLGLAVTPRAASWAEVHQARKSGTFEVALSAWWGDWPDPTAFLDLLVTGGAENDTGFSDLLFDGLLVKLRALAPGKARDAAVAQALVQVATDGAVLPLLSYASVNQIDLRRWSGWWPNPTDIHPWSGVGPKK